MNKKILSKVDKYYTDKVISNGTESRGVDWNSKESHFLRFTQLISKFDLFQGNSLLDYGCGYGALLDFFDENKIKIKNYVGYDISNKMISKAKDKFPLKKNSFFSNIDFLEDKQFDYVLANGIFNVRLDVSEEKWLEYILKTLNHINSLSSKGFSFNILTKYSDKEFMREYLYYADPLFLFDYCKTNFSDYVTLLHDYPLYEFSIIVKKQNI